MFTEFKTKAINFELELILQDLEFYKLQLFIFTSLIKDLRQKIPLHTNKKNNTDNNGSSFFIFENYFYV